MSGLWQLLTYFVMGISMGAGIAIGAGACVYADKWLANRRKK